MSDRIQIVLMPDGSVSITGLTVLEAEDISYGVYLASIDCNPSETEQLNSLHKSLTKIYDLFPEY